MNLRKFLAESTGSYGRDAAGGRGWLGGERLGEGGH
jgi:hypothetical protein